MCCCHRGDLTQPRVSDVFRLPPCIRAIERQSSDPWVISCSPRGRYRRGSGCARLCLTVNSAVRQPCDALSVRNDGEQLATFTGVFYAFYTARGISNTLSEETYSKLPGNWAVATWYAVRKLFIMVNNPDSGYEVRVEREEEIRNSRGAFRGARNTLVACSLRAALSIQRWRPVGIILNNLPL